VSVEATNPAGEPQLSQGEDLYIAIEYKLNPRRPKVHFQIQILTQHEAMLTCADTRLGEQPEFPGQEEGKALCVFPSIPLITGTYFVRVSMLDPDNLSGTLDTFGWEADQRSCSFQVKPYPATPGGEFWPSDWTSHIGLIILPSAWSLPDAPTGPSQSPEKPYIYFEQMEHPAVHSP
jgi:hypothetical protein